jgi:hypothetical protein
MHLHGRMSQERRMFTYYDFVKRPQGTLNMNILRALFQEFHN